MAGIQKRKALPAASSLMKAKLATSMIIFPGRCYSIGRIDGDRTGEEEGGKCEQRGEDLRRNEQLGLVFSFANFDSANKESDDANDVAECRGEGEEKAGQDPAALSLVHGQGVTQPRRIHKAVCAKKSAKVLLGNERIHVESE